jgi:mannose-6-phosphate isomerase-like protein (cupin superfamily)
MRKDMDITKTRTELINAYPGCHVKVAEDHREVVAEISDTFAVAVIERSLAHFHRNTREVYRVLRGTLYVARGGQGHVLGVGETIVIEPGQIHSTRAPDEVESMPPWSVSDHFIV